MVLAEVSVPDTTTSPPKTVVPWELAIPAEFREPEKYTKTSDPIEDVEKMVVLIPPVLSEAADQS